MNRTCSNQVGRTWGMYRVVGSAILTALGLGAGTTSALAQPGQGRYFAKKQYDARPLPKFDETRARLPAPIYEENPLFVQMYWKTWELAFRNFYEPRPAAATSPSSSTRRSMTISFCGTPASSRCSVTTRPMRFNRENRRKGISSAGPALCPSCTSSNTESA